MKMELDNLRQEYELPESIENWGWKYHHLGIPTNKKMPNERYIRNIRFMYQDLTLVLMGLNG